MAKFVLFDIDGTLIDSGGAGLRALNQAMEDLTGIGKVFAGVDLAGKTDPQIIREGLERLGLPTMDGLPGALMDRYLTRLRREVTGGKGRLQPGVREILPRLRDTKGIHLGLLTGNAEQGARIKLGPFGLNAFFPIGAFGSDDEDRNHLLPVVARRFQDATGKTIGYDRCVVIGDTPRDVACAKVHGSRCIAVATGHYPVQRLEATGADLVLEDLSDTERVSQWIQGI